MLYRVKADALPLKVMIKKTNRSLVEAKTFDGLHLSGSVDDHERGIPV
jgi:hypothetical protein